MKELWKVSKQHAKRTSNLSDICKGIPSFWLNFTKDKIYQQKHNTFVSKITLLHHLSHNQTNFEPKNMPDYCLTFFTINLGMYLIFTDFQHCTWLKSTSCWNVWTPEPSLSILETSDWEIKRIINSWWWYLCTDHAWVDTIAITLIFTQLTSEGLIFSIFNEFL